MVFKNYDTSIKVRKCPYLPILSSPSVGISLLTFSVLTLAILATNYKNHVSYKQSKIQEIFNFHQKQNLRAASAERSCDYAK